nr:hypothetical protein HmN_000134200 [Hymenolepis microstoma]
MTRGEHIAPVDDKCKQLAEIGLIKPVSHSKRRLPRVVERCGDDAKQTTALISLQYVIMRSQSRVPWARIDISIAGSYSEHVEIATTKSTTTGPPVKRQSGSRNVIHLRPTRFENFRRSLFNFLLHPPPNFSALQRLIIQSDNCPIEALNKIE